MVKVKDYLSEESIKVLEEIKVDQRVKDAKRRMKTVGFLAIGMSVAYLYGRNKGLDIGYDIGELHGFKEAATSIMEGSVDAFNLGKLED